MKSALQRGSSLHQRAQHGAKPVPSYCRGSAASLPRCPLRVQASAEDVPQPFSWSQNRQQPSNQPVGAATGRSWGDDQSSSFPSTSTSPSTGLSSTSQQHYQDELLLNLRLNRYWSRSTRPAIDILSPHPSIDLDLELPEVHVIVFGADEQEQEGVYSHRSMGKDGLPIETIIGFQSSEDALRYSCQLEVTMDPHTPRVLSLPTDELIDFCMERGYRCKVERQGTGLSPPEKNVDLTDWERAQRLRQNVFAVLEDGEVHTYSHAELGPKQQELLDLYLGAGNPAEGIMDSGADTLLDSIRTRLESLLPPPEDQPQGSEGEGQETEGQEGEGQ